MLVMISNKAELTKTRYYINVDACWTLKGRSPLVTLFQNSGSYVASLIERAFRPGLTIVRQSRPFLKIISLFLLTRSERG